MFPIKKKLPLKPAMVKKQVMPAPNPMAQSSQVLPAVAPQPSTLLSQPTTAPQQSPSQPAGPGPFAAMKKKPRFK